MEGTADYDSPLRPVVFPLDTGFSAHQTASGAHSGAQFVSPLAANGGDITSRFATFVRPRRAIAQSVGHTTENRGVPGSSFPRHQFEDLPEQPGG